MKPLAIDLFAGLGGWTEGLLAEGWDVVGFDIERHVYGEHRYPAQLVLQDVLTLTGAQFRGKVSLIVASPPCQFFSYCAMPWSRAKKLAAEVRADPVKLEQELALFNACVRIGKEAEIPIIIENVRGAIPWVGRSRYNYGSFHLWGDVPALMPMKAGRKMSGYNFQKGNPNVWGPNHISPSSDRFAAMTGQKVTGFRFDGSGKSFQTASVEHAGAKVGGDWFSDPDSLCRHGSKSPARKMASAMIAKIPEPLAKWIARTFKPV